LLGRLGEFTPKLVNTHKRVGPAQKIYLSYNRMGSASVDQRFNHSATIAQ
jgi:hypothetical protein